jgi:hypothetical protein
MAGRGAPIILGRCPLSAQWLYATNLSRLQRETRERERETSKRHSWEAHSVLTTYFLLPQRLKCNWGIIVSLRMLTNLTLATAQQRSTGQNLPSCLYLTFLPHSSLSPSTIYWLQLVRKNETHSSDCSILRCAYPRGKGPRYQLDRKLYGHRTVCKGNNSWPYPDS